jgi:hypothetical protein
MKYFVILFLIAFGGLLIPQTSFSLLAAQTPEELYDSHHTIIKGKILDYTAISQRQTLYDVEVIEYVKNPQEDKIIQAVGDGVKDGREWTSVDVIFDINDIVLLYLYHTDDSFTISPYSRIIEGDFVNPHISSYETASVVFDKSFSITQKQVKYVIPYEITSGTINDMTLNCESPSLVLSISSSKSGILKVDLPRKMIGNVFNVLVNSQEWTDEGQVSIDGNILTVMFPENTSKIEFLGSYYISSNTDGVCDVVHNPPYSYILSPLKQIKSGIDPYQIICKLDFFLVHKYDGTPACVNDFHKIELMTRGWATFRINSDIVDVGNIVIDEGDGHGYLYDSKIIDESKIQVNSWYGKQRVPTLNVGDKIISGCNPEVSKIDHSYMLILTLQYVDAENKKIGFSGKIENWPQGWCDSGRMKSPVGWKNEWNALVD